MGIFASSQQYYAVQFLMGHRLLVKKCLGVCVFDVDPDCQKKLLP